jgi:hypothetical protein
MARYNYIFKGAFEYDPSTGDLSTTPEFGGFIIGTLPKHLSVDEVREAIFEMGDFLKDAPDPS